jgi:hypothetical protein
MHTVAQVLSGGQDGVPGDVPETAEALRERLRKLADTSAARRRIRPPEPPQVESDEPTCD